MRALRMIVLALTVMGLGAGASRGEPATRPAAPVTDADPETLLGAYDAAEPEKFDASRRGDASYVREYIEQMESAQRRKVAAGKRFLDAAPGHAQAPRVRKERWELMVQVEPETLVGEADAVLAADSDDAARADALYAKAMGIFRTSGGRAGGLEPVVDQFVAAAPRDPRGAMLLSMLADMAGADHARAKAIHARIIKDYPDSFHAKMAAGKLRQADAVGEPFELSFTDAISGRSVSMADLKGKVVVIDFWATWCGPCVAEMPKLKELYAKYHDQGLEIVGVSLDAPEAEGGLKALTEFVATEQIGWPQYYQGKGWEGEFSSKWGIQAIPSVFVVDRAGRLHSTNARGQLETMVPQLLGNPQ